LRRQTLRDDVSSCGLLFRLVREKKEEERGIRDRPAKRRGGLVVASGCDLIVIVGGIE